MYGTNGHQSVVRCQEKEKEREEAVIECPKKRFRETSTNLLHHGVNGSNENTEGNQELLKVRRTSELGKHPLSFSDSVFQDENVLFKTFRSNVDRRGRRQHV